MKGIYIYHDLQNAHASKQVVGVLKKINTQYELFKSSITEDFVLLNLKRNYNNNSFLRFFAYIFLQNAFDITALKKDSFDFVYIRRINPNCRSVLCMLKNLKKNNKNCKIVYEIPTYPYDFEHKGTKGKIQLIIDKLFRNKLHKYVDRIVTLTEDKEIFCCPTLQITNGVDVKSIPVSKKKTFDSNNISLIAVAQFAFWHGYERVIEGLHNYYDKGGMVNVTLHLVGNGPELEKYRQLVSIFHLENNVIFHGALYGEQLNEVFDVADIALCSLACHKINIYIASELKSREYLCRGLPIVTSTKIDIINKDFKYALHIPEDDSAVNIVDIVDFACKLYESSRSLVTSEIRTFAEENCDMESAMKDVIAFYKG